MRSASAPTRRPREGGEEDENEGGRRVRQNRGVASLPPPVLAIAARNRKRRFFVPSTDNTFCGIRYEQVMIDSGCNSFLLPFPENPNDLTSLEGDQYRWSISSSGGTGAIRSPTLRIERVGDRPVGQMRLAFSTVPVDLPSLRFHLGSESAASLLQHPKLIDIHKNSLQAFLDSLGTSVSSERQHVLLGQFHLDQVCCIQNGPVMIMLPKNHNLPVKIGDLCDSCAAFADPFVVAYDGFHDLEDEDHDGDDQEDRRLSWDSDDYIDERETCD